MPDPFDFTPTGLDRATGVGGFPGTPTLASAMKQTAPAGYFEELPDSPEIERGEQCTITHRFKCDWETGLDLVTGIGRGSMFQDSFGNITRCLTSRLTHGRGEASIFELICESISFDIPPDEFEVEPVELNPALEKHPRYNNGENALTETLLELIHAAVNMPQDSSRVDAETRLSSEADTVEQYHLAIELLAKLRKGEDTFYLPGYQVRWTQYYFLPPDINPGGYIEDPVADGGLPVYFWSDTGDDTGNNIFTTLAADVDPQYYGDGISWLRFCDNLHFQRTWFRVTRSWVGAPFAHWDADIYGTATPP